MQVRADAAAAVKDGNYGIFQLQYDISNEDPRLTRGWKKPLKIAVSGDKFRSESGVLFIGCLEVASYQVLSCLHASPLQDASF